MARSLVIVAFVLVLLAGGVSGASGEAGTPFHNPYSCGLCLFEMPLSTGKMRILLGNPSVLSIDDLSPVRGEIVFSRTEQHDVGLYVAHLDGSGERRVATGERGMWSPDGTQIAYQHVPAVPSQTHCSGAALWVVAPDGGGDHPVEPGCTSGGRWSPDSRRLAYFTVTGLNNDAGTLTIATADGATRRPLVKVQRPTELSWSPRGDRLAYTAFPEASPSSGHGVSAGGPRKFTVSAVELVRQDGKPLATFRDSANPAWTPRGEIVFSHTDRWVSTGYEMSETRGSTRIASADGRRVRVLHRPWGAFVQWLPGGKRFGYVAGGPSPEHGESADQIFFASWNGSRPRQVTHFLPGGAIRGFRISPDGSRLWILWEVTDVD